MSEEFAAAYWKLHDLGFTVEPEERFSFIVKKVSGSKLAELALCLIGYGVTVYKIGRREYRIVEGTWPFSDRIPSSTRTRPIPSKPGQA